MIEIKFFIYIYLANDFILQKPYLILKIRNFHSLFTNVSHYEVLYLNNIEG